MAFASIHTTTPLSQFDHEGLYKGYSRVGVECEIGSLYMRMIFPEVQEDTDLTMTHVAIGENESGDGRVFISLSCLPHIPLKIMQPGKVPNVIITYPDTLAKSARIAHQMVALGRIRPEEFDPKFFESVNDHLQAHGIPILTVVRGASAGWKGSLANMPSFGLAN